MAVNTKNTKYFYPPRPGSGAGTFSDNIVGLQTVEGGGLTQGNFEFTTAVTEKVNRTFNVGAFSEPMTLDMMNIDSLEESRRILATQFRVYPNFDITQVLNFSMYGSLSERFRVSITKIINYFPASLDVLFSNGDFVTGNTAYDIVYDEFVGVSYGPGQENLMFLRIGILIILIWTTVLVLMITFIRFLLLYLRKHYHRVNLRFMFQVLLLVQPQLQYNKNIK